MSGTVVEAGDKIVIKNTIFEMTIFEVWVRWNTVFLGLQWN